MAIPLVYESSQSEIAVDTAEKNFSEVEVKLKELEAEKAEW
jgi:hypothetical protein